MARKKSKPLAFSDIESNFWYAYALSGIWYGTWKARTLFDKNVSPTYPLHAKAMAVVVFDRAINGEDLHETVS